MSTVALELANAAERPEIGLVRRVSHLARRPQPDLLPSRAQCMHRTPDLHSARDRLTSARLVLAQPDNTKISRQILHQKLQVHR